jgi:hypothetical protein
LDAAREQPARGGIELDVARQVSGGDEAIAQADPCGRGCLGEDLEILEVNSPITGL